MEVLGEPMLIFLATRTIDIGDGVVMEVLGEPTLIFLATRTIDIGDELLFDYNDHQSSLTFLRSCSVCGQNQKRPGPTEGNHLF